MILLKASFPVWLSALALGEPIVLQNPGVELNNGIDATPLSDSSLMGWGGDGILSEGDTDFGNGRWKILFDESGSAVLPTSHQIQEGEAYSLRFDAALSPDTSIIPPNAIVGGALLNGDFNADGSEVDQRSFADTPHWFNLAGNQSTTATTLSGSLPVPDNSRNALITDDGSRLFAIDTNYTLTTGQKLELSYQWRDGSGWNDNLDQVRVTLFVTNDDTPGGVRTDLGTLLSGPSTVDSTYQTFEGGFSPIPAGGNGKRLFVLIEGVDGDTNPDGTAHLDHFVLSLFNPLLVGPNVRNGDFNLDDALADVRSFAQTPFWTNLTGNQNYECTRTNLLYDGTRCAVLRQSGASTPVFANDTEYDLETGDILSLSFQWRDAFNWTDNADSVDVFIYTTADNTIGGTRTVLQTLNTGTSNNDNQFQLYSNDFDPIPASADGKRLFAAFTAVDGNGDSTGYGRMENFTLSVNEDDPVLPPAPPEAQAATLIAEAYVDNGGTPLVIASRTFTLTSERDTEWNHYHLAIPAGTADAHVGKEIGVRFRGPGSGDDLFRYVDNVRLDHYPADLPDGRFSSDWDVPDRVWPGPGYWGNRLQDWELLNNRVNCSLVAKPRRTLHRTGSSIRGNGEDFYLTVHTGIHVGTIGPNARAGFLIGAGPNLDWRASLLVHDGLGRDFGTFLGLNEQGAVVIEDLTKGGIIPVATGDTPASGFPSEGRLALYAIYQEATGEYALTVSSFSTGGSLLSQATVNVPSARVLGSFGLLANRSSSGTSFWFDQFNGAGEALQPEPDRNLAIVGAMHTLHEGTLRLTAQLAPINLATTPNPTLEIYDGTNWNEIANAPIDNTDNLSSYTATFTIPSWDDTRDTPYRVGVQVDGKTYHWGGTIRKGPVDKNEIVVINTSCQRIADENVESDTMDWSPVKVWHPHLMAFEHITKHDGDVLLALGDQIYEGQPTGKDTSSDHNRHYDYLYKWYFWMLEARDLAKDMPTISIPDDHDVFQGNLWGAGGLATNDQTTGGYEQPASWVRLVDRTQTSHMPTPDPYNPIQPAPSIAQGIGVYFTGMTYGEVGFAIIEDRKFKTGPNGAPADPAQQFLLGDRQKEFLKTWNTDWDGQKIKCVVSQSPFGMIHTHASSGYGFGLNDRDAHGWPQHRREEVWEILRQSRSFQLAGDQHIATLVHHGVEDPADAGYSFTSPAITNFFPRVWDPVHNSSGRTATVSPYKGDFYLNGVGTLPSGEPNLTSDHPGHIRIIGAANPLEYYDQTRNINPANQHDRGAGYGIIRIKKDTRQITFEAWPIHADPEYPQTGSQFPDWPVTIHQTDNDGRTPTGFLPVIRTHWESNPVISVFNENTNELLYAMRFPGNIVRPPVYDNEISYRVEITYNDAVPETLINQTAATDGSAAIHSFTALQPAVIAGESAILQWNVEGATELIIDNGIGDITSVSVNGVGHLSVSPSDDTTYTLTLNGALTAQTTVRVFPTQPTWRQNNFPGAELQDESISGNNADPDGDGFTNEEEYNFQTNPRSSRSVPLITAGIVVSTDPCTLEFTSAVPLQADHGIPKIQFSNNLEDWHPLSPLAGDFKLLSRNDNPAEGTSQLTFQITLPKISPAKEFYRSVWEFN